MAPQTVSTVSSEVQSQPSRRQPAPLTEDQLKMVRRAVTYAYRPLRTFADVLDQSDTEVKAEFVGEILDVLYRAADDRLDKDFEDNQFLARFCHGGTDR